MKNIFDSLYILEKNFLVNKCKKQTCYKESKLCFLDFMRNGHVFPSKVCRFQCNHRLFFSRTMGNIRMCKEVCLQKLLKFRFCE